MRQSDATEPARPLLHPASGSPAFSPGGENAPCAAGHAASQGPLKPPEAIFVGKTEVLFKGHRKECFPKVKGCYVGSQNV